MSEQSFVVTVRVDHESDRAIYPVLFPGQERARIQALLDWLESQYIMHGNVELLPLKEEKNPAIKFDFFDLRKE